MAKDHENGKIRVVDFESFTWYGQAPGIFRDWAGLFVKIADAPAGLDGRAGQLLRAQALVARQRRRALARGFFAAFARSASFTR